MLCSVPVGASRARAWAAMLGDGEQGFIFRLADLPPDSYGASLAGCTFTLIRRDVIMPYSTTSRSLGGEDFIFRLADL